MMDKRNLLVFYIVDITVMLFDKFKRPFNVCSCSFFANISDNSLFVRNCIIFFSSSFLLTTSGRFLQNFLVCFFISLLVNNRKSESEQNSPYGRISRLTSGVLTPLVSVMGFQLRFGSNTVYSTVVLSPVLNSMQLK